MKYFMQDDIKRLSWSAPICNDGKVDSKDGAIAEGGIFVSSSKCRMFGVGKVQWVSPKTRIPYDFSSYVGSMRLFPKNFRSAALCTATQPW
jgi:hypothetical protein